VALVVGISTAIIAIGRRDAHVERNQIDIAALNSISSDLIKTSIQSKMELQFHDIRLVELFERVERLER
jgi:hypothetical protein